MRILIAGGYGLIGGYVMARLAADGHALVGVGRDVRAARRRFPYAQWLALDLGRARPEAWGEALEGVDAVVNCAGALQDGGRDHLRGVHVDGLKLLAEMARSTGAKRIVHVSAAGVDTSPGAFGATKRDAEALLEQLDGDWVVLRPGLVLAPNAYGGSALLRALAAFPGFIPAVRADQPVQVVGVHDVAEAVARALTTAKPARITVDLVAAEPTTIEDILRALRAWFGLAPAPILQIPVVLARLTGRIADATAFLGWRSPLRTTALEQLAAGVQGDPSAAERLLGLRVRGLAEILAETPSGVQERWFAGLYLLKPLCIAVLAVFWAASGIVGLWRWSQAATLLTASGFDRVLAHSAVVSGSLTDLILAGLVCHRASGRVALWGMLGVSTAYVVGACLWRPDLWADPLGPMVKVPAGMALAAVTLALWPER